MGNRDAKLGMALMLSAVMGTLLDIGVEVGVNKVELLALVGVFCFGALVWQKRS